MSDEKPKTDFDLWLANLANKVKTKGFEVAWIEHLTELFDELKSGRQGFRLSPANVFNLLMVDKTFEDHYQGLSLQKRKEFEEHLKEFTAGLNTKRPQVKLEDFSEIHEADGSPIKCLSGEVFQNWGRTVKNTPSYTFFPKTIGGIVEIVTWARQNKKRVRVSGYRHTWTDLYSNDGEVLISLLPLDVVNNLPASEPPIDPTNQLQGIEIVGEIQEDGTTKALCRIGAATTNEQFRQWCLSKSKTGGNWNWTLPLNVIMVEITFGGSNGPICHGAGWHNQTLSDLVVEIEFIDAYGAFQITRDPDLIKSAAGCFGLLGIITSLTLKLDPMTFAVLRPTKPRIGLGVPPPDNYVVPSGVDMSGISTDDLNKAKLDFINRCENDYYSEWFWFTFQEQCWVNTWKNNGNKTDAKDYPGPLGAQIQELQEYVAGLLVDSKIFKMISEYKQAKLLGDSAMVFLPSDEKIVTPLIDGLHFRRGIQNMRVLDLEMEIPIPPRKDDPTKPDWSICQRAWWDAISLVYSTYNSPGSKVPMRLTLEMRIMADSEITMAPQNGNKFGTCAIEVLTTINTDRDEWEKFMQDITNLWTSYEGPDGKPLNVRPHWAKMWQGLTISGSPVIDYLKEISYKDKLPEFRSDLSKIGQQYGVSVKDMQSLFSNSLLDNLVWDDSA